MLNIKVILQKKEPLNFLYKLVRDFINKEGFQRANSLAYAILISFVPFFISIASIALFVLPNDIYTKIEAFILHKSLPAMGNEIAKYMQKFHQYAGKLSLISFTFLFITSILMLQSLRHHLTKLWEDKKNQTSLRIYIIDSSVMVIGPLLLGFGILLTTYLTSFSLNFSFIFDLIPLAFSIIAFTVIYKFIPPNKINFKQALVTGTIAAIIFEIAKKSFTIYIKYFATESILYGALATIPILILWLYISCLILLFCANINVFIHKKNNSVVKPRERSEKY